MSVLNDNLIPLSKNLGISMNKKKKRKKQKVGKVVYLTDELEAEIINYAKEHNKPIRISRLIFDLIELGLEYVQNMNNIKKYSYKDIDLGLKIKKALEESGLKIIEEKDKK